MYHYWIGPWIIHVHPGDDHRQFRLVLARLLNAGTFRQCELVRVFGVDRKMLPRASRQSERSETAMAMLMTTGTNLRMVFQSR